MIINMDENIPETKIKCSGCKQDKFKSEFSKKTSKKRGYEYFCKICKNEKRRLTQAKYYPSMKRWRINNPEKYKISKLKTIEKTKIKIAITKRKWLEENREKNNKNQLKYRQFKIKTNPSYKIELNLRRRITMAVRHQNTFKADKFINLCGCDINELKKYLESKFYPQELPNGLRIMTWNNYGIFGWHIDHILPCRIFNLTSLEEQKKCFHYTNLQPLWCKDNAAKIVNDMKLSKRN